MPQEGPAGELGADKGIFAAHDIDRALAQQCIVGVRGEEGQGVDVVVAVLPGAVATEMWAKRLPWLTGRNVDLPGSVAQGIQERRDGGVGIAEQVEAGRLAGAVGSGSGSGGRVFAQQSATTGRESGKEEIFRQRQAGVR